MNAYQKLGGVAVAGVGAAKGLSRAFMAPDKGTSKFSIELKASGASVRVSVKVLASFDGVNYVAPDDMASAILTVTDALQHIKTFSPTPAVHYKFQLDGDAGNGAGTVVDTLNVLWTQN